MDSKERTKALMSFIDLYALNHEENRIHFLRYRKNKKTDNSIKAAYEELIKRLGIMNDKIDAVYFIEDIRELRLGGVFYNKHQAEDLLAAFEGYNIDVPDTLKNAFSEIEIRSKVIKSISGDWDTQQEKDCTERIEAELETYSFDVSSKKGYLVKIHSDIIDEIKKLEKEALEKTGYYFDALFKTLNDKDKQRDLNLYYYNSAIKNKTITFFDIHRLLVDYINKRNEIALVKNLIKGDNVMKKNTLSHLSASELALRHIYLERSGIEPYIDGPSVGKKYGHFKNSKNIELAFNAFSDKSKKVNIKQLQNISHTLFEYPNIQKALQNDIDKLK